MKIAAKVNGIPCELEISDEQVVNFMVPDAISELSAAKMLGIHRNTFRARARKHGLKRNPLTGKYSRDEIQRLSK